MRGVERAREEARDSVLDSGEQAALSAALDRLDERHPASVAAIRVAALTGLRISEVCSIRWEHVDFENGRVTLPQTKTGRRVHHFPDAVLVVMRSRPQINRNDHVFAVDACGPLTYRTARTHFAVAARLAGLTDVWLHDLRRTTADCHDERGGGGCRRARAARPAGSQDYGDGGPVRAGGWLASRGRTARRRRRDGGDDGRGRGSRVTLAWHAVGILAFGSATEASKCSTTTSCISPVIRRC